jgi:hypothetical protein
MIKKYFIFLIAIASVQSALAISVDWTGGYRLEYTDIDNPTLATPGGKKNYATQYLYLAPKVIASDGINIVSRFDIMGSEVAAYRNSQQGVFLGGGVSGAAGQNATTQNADATQLRVSQLYLNIQHEFGELVAGRAPIQFGMGITHNAGLGDFDHWNDTRDLILYKFKVDNIYFMPIFAKIKQTNYEVGNTVAEQTYVLEYDNKDIGAKTGVFYQTRTSSDQSNDSLAAGIPGAVAVNGGISIKTINIFLERRWPSFEMRLEGSFQTGSTGLVNATSEQINVDSYAVVAELLAPQLEESKWEWGAKLGAVSGDDPTTSKYEGYQLDRNYDVAMLLFNHRMGSADFLTTGITRAGSGTTVANSADEESIGNAMFVSPHFKYAYDEKIDIKTALTYAQLMTNPGNFTDFKKDLGFEIDLELIYKPRERVTWSTGLGFLAPGEAWTGGASNFDNKATWGFSTKAAITF